VASKKTPQATAKNLQIRLGPQAYEQVKRIAERREKSIADTIREAIEVYAINLAYAERQQPLFWVDNDGNKTMVLIPGFNTSAAPLMPPTSDTQH
jgi:hypothetical protein